MQTVYVQFTDSTEATIESVFSCPQNPSIWPNQGEVPSNDGRYASYYGALPPIMQQGMIAPGE